MTAAGRLSPYQLPAYLLGQFVGAALGKVPVQSAQNPRAKFIFFTQKNNNMISKKNCILFAYAFFKKTIMSFPKELLIS
jgi:hypothetical protein